jgi:hypothetical protein
MENASVIAMKTQHTDNGSPASPATEPIFFDDIPPSGCLGANAGIIMQTLSTVVWRPIPNTDDLDVYILRRLYRMIRQGTLASVLIDLPGNQPVYFVQSDVAAVLREFTNELAP